MAWPDTPNTGPSNPSSGDLLVSPDHNYQHNYEFLQVEAMEEAWKNAASFTAFTLGTFTQGATTVTFSTQWAYYRRFGKLIAADIGITFTSAGSSGGDCALNLPSTPFTWQTYANAATGGHFWFERTGIVGYLGGVFIGPGVHQIYFVQAHNTAGIGLNPAYAIASGDTLRAHFMGAVT